MKEKERGILKVIRYLCLSFVIAFGLMAIVGTGDDGGVIEGPEGVFVDSPVAGIYYSSSPSGHTGYTGPGGTFNYSEGDTITFYLGDPENGGVMLGIAPAADMVSPVDLVAAVTDETDPQVTNICILLQSLDQDGDLNNGITITQAMRDLIEGRTINFNQDTDAFRADPNVTDLFTALNNAGVFTDTDIGDRTLCTATEAQAHMAGTLASRKTVTTAQGRVRGYAYDAHTWAWKGIPYAMPPVGALRWKAPQDPEPWEGVREATAPCSECTQYYTSPNWIRQPNAIGSEDCLYLDIYRPQSGETDLPVYVWIHGGSNNFGTAKNYNGSVMAYRSNMVVVIIQYRLGPLGWITHPALRAGENALDDSGNFGTLDTIKALEWIRDNIAAFGGNPNNVTIAGESAGAHNVMKLVISPWAAGLFHRAISESGGMTTISVAEGEALANRLIDGLLVYDGTVMDLTAAATYRGNMSNAEIEAYLKGKTNKNIYEVLMAVYGSIGTYNAYRDGAVVPGRVLETIESGNYNQVPIILGSNEYETKAFMPLYGPAFGMPWFDLIDVLKGNQALDDVLPADLDKALYQVTGYYGSRNWRAKFVDERTRALKGQQDDVWGYLFKWGGEGSGPTPFDFIYGAGHAMEIPFFFGSDTSLWGYSFNPDNDTAGRVALQDAMMAYVANFAHNGDPNGSGLFQWEEWSNDAGAPKCIVFDSDADQALLSMTNEEVTIPGVYGELTAELATWDATYGAGTYATWNWLPWSFQWSTVDP